MPFLQSRSPMENQWPRSEAVENSYFDDAAFAGDSRIAGIAELYVLADTTARIYGSVSLDVSKATMRTVFPLVMAVWAR